jgi:hypothetical protein
VGNRAAMMLYNEMEIVKCMYKTKRFAFENQIARRGFLTPPGGHCTAAYRLLPMVAYQQAAGRSEITMKTLS